MGFSTGIDFCFFGFFSFFCRTFFCFLGFCIGVDLTSSDSVATGDSSGCIYSCTGGIYASSGCVYSCTGGVYGSSGCIYSCTGGIYASSGCVYSCTGGAYDSSGWANCCLDGFSFFFRAFFCFFGFCTGVGSTGSVIIDDSSICAGSCTGGI